MGSVHQAVIGLGIVSLGSRKAETLKTENQGCLRLSQEACLVLANGFYLHRTQHENTKDLNTIQTVFICQNILESH